jgi:hypothetical protein
VTKRIVFPREVLLLEVERRCGEPLCGARTRLSLTKGEARAYTGFECARCGRWFADALSGRDVPEWAGEFGLPLPEPSKPAHETAFERVGAVGKKKTEEKEEEEDVGEVVARMSEAWRRMGGEREAAPEVAGAERGNSS